MAGLRVCRKCGEEKHIEKFPKDKYINGGFRWQCKECRKLDYKKYYEGKKRENLNAFKKRNLEHHLKHFNHITIDEYDNFLNTQQGRCAICDKEETTVGRWGTVLRLSVDHNHKTGKVRGLLCSKCNHGLGLFDEDINVLLEAIQYLRKF